MSVTRIIWTGLMGGLARVLAALVFLTVVLFVFSPAVALAGEPPVKEIVRGHFGWRVDKTTGGNVCTISSGDECQPGSLSSVAGGFGNPQGIAVAPDHNVLVADSLNSRVQELQPDGKFVLMFGSNVNRKGGDLCTAGEEAECQTGTAGVAPGQLGSKLRVAVNPANGNVYVSEVVNGSGGSGYRVQEFTATGEWVLEIGREVNETKDQSSTATVAEKNLCTEEEVVGKGVKCTHPKMSTKVEPTSEPGAFVFSSETGNRMVVGGPEGLLYVGDEHRVQEFDTKTGSDGVYKTEIPLSSLSSKEGAAAVSVAVDQTGDVYVVYVDQSTGEGRKAIHEFDPAGKEARSFPVAYALTIALDSTGRLAVSESVAVSGSPVPRGSLYEVGVSGLHLVTRFDARGSEALAFDSTNDDLYGTVTAGQPVEPANQEVLAYEPVPVGELTVTGAQCSPGPDRETDATFDCALKGEVDPWGVPGTEAWFEWGRTPQLGTETPKQPVATGNSPVPISAPVGEARPNETFYVQAAGEDQNVHAPELLTSTVVPFTTPSVPPRITGTLEAAFASPSSIVMVGTVNPENTNTEYEFQYTPQSDCQNKLLEEGKTLAEACANVQQAPALENSTYGQIAAAQEVRGLQPASTYRYRLYAVNTKGQGAVGQNGQPGVPEGSFTTSPAPVVSVQTDAASMITSTSALISGTVQPDGQPTVYQFEIGVYEGASTRYGVVFSGSAGISTIEEQQSLTGLQPGTTYAYRITAHFGDGTNPGSSAIGQTLTFTTPGLPAVLVSPPVLGLLNIPNIGFPKPVVTSKKRTHTNRRKTNKHKHKLKRRRRGGTARGHNGHNRRH